MELTRSGKSLAVLGTLLASCPLAAEARQVVAAEEDALEHASFVAADYAGCAASISGDLAALGAQRDDLFGSDVGSVTTFERQGGEWVSTQQLGPTAGIVLENDFGAAVQLDGSTLVVGAPHTFVEGVGFDAGRVFLFEHDGASWSPAGVIDDPVGVADAEFGLELALEGDVLAVATSEYRVLVFRRVGGAWVVEDQLLGARGRSLSLDGDRLLVGDIIPPSVQLFERMGSAWILTESFTASTGFFGNTVSLSGPRIAVGAPLAEQAGLHVGAVHTYVEGPAGWEVDEVLWSPTAVNTYRYGQAVALDGDRLAIVVAGDNISGPGSGSVRLLEPERFGWKQTARFSGSQSGNGTSFGWEGVEFDGDQMIVPELGWNPPLGEGRAYVFLLGEAFTPLCFGDGSGSGCPCGNSGAPGRGCANSAGGGAQLSAQGTSRPSVDDLEFRCTGLPAGQTALLFAGHEATVGGAGSPFGDGLRCAATSVVRLVTAAANGAGGVAYGPGLNALEHWTGGDRRVFQVWYRDPAGGPCASGFNLSSAVEVFFGP